MSPQRIRAGFVEKLILGLRITAGAFAWKMTDDFSAISSKQMKPKPSAARSYSKLVIANQEKQRYRHEEMVRMMRKVVLATAGSK